MAGPAVTALRVAEQRFVGRVGHWTRARWAGAASERGAACERRASADPGASTDGADAGGPDRTRADIVHALVQVLADLGAEAERRPRRAVPRLASDLALPDQVRVMVADLMRAEPLESQLQAATAAIDGTLAAL